MASATSLDMFLDAVRLRLVLATLIQEFHKFDTNGGSTIVFQAELQSTLGDLIQSEWIQQICSRLIDKLSSPLSSSNCKAYYEIDLRSFYAICECADEINSAATRKQVQMPDPYPQIL